MSQPTLSSQRHPPSIHLPKTLGSFFQILQFLGLVKVLIMQKSNFINKDQISLSLTISKSHHLLLNKTGQYSRLYSNWQPTAGPKSTTIEGIHLYGRSSSPLHQLFRHLWLQRAAGESHATNCDSVLYICRAQDHLSQPTTRQIELTRAHTMLK